MADAPFYESFLQRNFPAWGASRAAARAAQSASNVRASYSDGVSTRVSETFAQRLPLSMQSQSDRWSLRWMRDRSRKAYRGNPIARGLVNTETDNVVSHGMSLQAQTDSEEFNDEAEEKFEAWLQTADIRGMLDGPQLQRSAWKESRVDGDGLIVLVSRGNGEAATSKLQYIRGDLICSRDGQQSASLLDGVEIDSFGRPIAFHVLYQNEYGKRDWTRIDAADAVYICHATEAYDVRGSPCYATVFDLLNNLEQYVDGVALAAWMATVFGVIIKDESAAKQVSALNTTTNSQGQQQKVITFENGQVKFMGEKGQVMQVDAKQPMQQTPDFVRMMLRLIGVPFDMPLELVLKDVSQSNLSSLRGGIQAFQRACKAKQCVYAGPNQWGKIYRWWVSREVKLQRFTTKAPANFFAHEWMFHGWQFTDPVTDVQAALLEVDAGFNTRKNVMEMLGRDPKAITKQLAAEKEERDELELADVASNLTRDRTEPAPEDPAPTGENNADK
jgi:lambda family phage portal protein